MKYKSDFITNSSSTAFIITNKSKHHKDLVDFVIENPQLVDMFIDEYDPCNSPEYTQENMTKSAKENNIQFKSGEKVYCIFGDEDGTLIGKVFDYILREGGSSKNFTWSFSEYLR